MGRTLEYWFLRSRTGDHLGYAACGAILAACDSVMAKVLVCIALVVGFGTAVVLDVLDPRETL